MESLPGKAVKGIHPKEVGEASDSQDDDGKSSDMGYELQQEKER